MDATEIVASLDSGLRKRLVMGDAVSFETQALPSVGLTKALRGGFPYGRQVLVYGSKSSAKSSFCLELVAKAQADGKVCAWIDSEMSYDSSWAERLGVDTSQLIVSEARTVNDMVDVATQLMSAGIDLIVVDSISSLLPAVYFDKKSDNLKALEDTKQVGAEARDFSNAMKMLNYANNRVRPTLLVLISQTRTNINMMFSSQQPTGGNAVKFYSSIIIKLFSSESENNAIKTKRELGNKIIETNAGREVNWMVQFSKTSPSFVSGKYDFYFDGDKIGIDKEGEVLDAALLYGLIEQAGKWYYINDKKLNGKRQAIDYLRHNQGVMDELERQVASV